MQLESNTKMDCVQDINWFKIIIILSLLTFVFIIKPYFIIIDLYSLKKLLKAKRVANIKNEKFPNKKKNKKFPTKI